MKFEEVCRIYNKEDKYLVLNPTVPSWIITNINGVLLLKFYREDKTFDEIAGEFLEAAPKFSRITVMNFLQYAKEERLFDIEDEYTYNVRELSELCLNITDICNLHCTYCIVAQRVENDRYLSIDDYKNLLNQAKAVNPNMNILITGGEPLTSELTLPVAQYARSIGFVCSMLTNGTLISEKNIDELVSLFSEFQISIDGSSAEIHDYYRGEGSYERAKHGVDLLISHGANVKVAVVVTKRNMHDIAKLSEQWEGRLVIQPLFPFGKSNSDDKLNLTGMDYYETLSKIQSHVPYVGLFPVVKRERQRKQLPKCGMGDGMLSISCTGNVYPCNNLHGAKYRLGNLFEQSLEDIYNSPLNNEIKKHTVNSIEKCRVCDFKLICGGSCQARNFCESGDLDIASGFCEYDRTAIINGLIDSAQFRKL